MSPTLQDLSNDTTFSQIKYRVPVPLNRAIDTCHFRPSLVFSGQSHSNWFCMVVENTKRIRIRRNGADSGGSRSATLAPVPTVPYHMSVQAPKNKRKLSKCSLRNASYYNLIEITIDKLFMIFSLKPHLHTFPSVLCKINIRIHITTASIRITGLKYDK